MHLYLKNFYHRYYFEVNMPKSVRCYGRGIVFRGKNITIGERTTINNYVVFNAEHSSISIGSDCRISDGVQIVAISLNKKLKHITAPIKIGNKVWIGAGSIILPGVQIGDNAIVGAGAVVTKNINSNSIVVGIPAKELHNREVK